MMRRFGMVFGLLLVLPMLSFAQDGTVTAPFVSTTPVIDGVVSAGEWDAAGVAAGTWTLHDSATEATLNTTVKVCYSLDAVYFLYECEDPNVQSAATGTEYLGGMSDKLPGYTASSFAFGGETDYIALYVDPAGYADDKPNADSYSYSIQWEPSITAKNEKDPRGNSYSYTETGRWGGFVTLFDEPLVDSDGVTYYWGGGQAWNGKDMQIVDGPSSNGFVCELKIPWGSFNGYWQRYMETGADLGGNEFDIFINNGYTEPLMTQWGGIKMYELDADGNGVRVGTGIADGMPAAGTVWKVQFCRFSNGDLGYANWVGTTGGFVSRPFGNLIFGTATPSAVEDALLH